MYQNLMCDRQGMYLIPILITYVGIVTTLGYTPIVMQ
jgi:hypothetical protein